jgi:hypothetical protein
VLARDLRLFRGGVVTHPMFGDDVHDGAAVGQSAAPLQIQQRRLAQPKSFLNVATVMCGHPKFT